MPRRRRRSQGEHKDDESVDPRSIGGKMGKGAISRLPGSSPGVSLPGGDQRFRVRDQAFAALPKSGARSPPWL
jgi:hypothetical protein